VGSREKCHPSDDIRVEGLELCELAGSTQLSS
jgi:hypothetical protein